MSVLDSIINLKRMEDERELRDISQVSTAVDSYINAQDAASRIKAREPSALDDLITRGKAADAARSLGDRDTYNRILNLKTPKGPVDTINKSLDPIAQVSERTATSIDDFLHTEKEDALLADLSTQVDSFTGKPTGEAIIAKNKMELKQEKAKKNIESSSKLEDTISQSSLIKQDLNDVFDDFLSIPESIRGPAAGRTTGQLEKLAQTKGGGEAAQLYEDSLSFFLSNLARSLGGERGVLTDRDIARVKSFMPQLRDNPSLAKTKIKKVNDFIDRRINEAKSRTEGNPPGEFNQKQIQQMSDEELMKLLGGEE